MEKAKKRPNWDEYFMNLAKTAATRATCNRGQSGAVIVKDGHIVATGYVGAPPGLPHCDEIGHLMREVIDEKGNKSQHCIRTTHAEVNAIYQAAKIGVAVKGATLYCKMTPCYVCAQAIITVGITRVVCEKDYHQSELTKEWFEKLGIELVILNQEIETYENM